MTGAAVRLRSRSRGQSGFTLIELLVVVALSAIVLVPMFGLLNMTYRRLNPVRDTNDTAAQLRVFRTSLRSDWAKARVIRLNKTTLPVEANRSLSAARMDCRGGVYPYYRSGVTPLLAINTQVSGNNNGQRIVYSAFARTDERGRNVIDIVRRECGHLPDVQPPSTGGYDYWSSGCGASNPACNIPTNPAGYTATQFERVVASGLTEFTSYRSCNNLTTAPPYRPCDVNLTAEGVDGQVTTVRLSQRLASTGRMTAGTANANVGLDIEGRPS